MKRNPFGDMKIQPADDLELLWQEEFSGEDKPELTAFAIANDTDAGMGWTASIEDTDGNESELHDFESEDQLREYLVSWNVRIDNERT